MKIKVVNKSKHGLPEYKTKSSAGMDICANLEEPIMLKPLERKLVPTGIFIELPEGYAFTRSGGDSKAQFSLETKQTLQLGEIAMGQTLESIHIGALKPSAV